MNLRHAPIQIHSRTRMLVGAWLGLFALTSMVWAVDYHISPSGDDANDGRTPATAWRTIGMANSFAFQPGDRLLLEGGARFEGTLSLDGGDGGDPGRPVVITSYGEGRAVLDGGQSHAIHVVNTRGLVVRNLRLVGSGRNTSQRGVGVLLDPGHDAHLDAIEASGFQIAGIMVTGGSENVRVTLCYVHDNGYTGIGTGYFYGRSSINRNIYVGHNRAIANPGISDETAGFRDQSGSGINLYRVEGGLVEFNESTRNGADFFHRGHNGPVGIWTAWCRDVVIQFNISHSNQAWYVAGNHRRGDGGGIDLDSGSKDCVVQYNYAYDNAAAGFMLCAYTNEERHRLEGNIVRCNISENDGRQDHRAGFVIHAPEAQSNSHIYHNVIFNSDGRDVLICNYNGYLWPAEVREAFVDYVRDGGGVVIVHAANNAFANWPEYNEIIGLGGWEGRNERWGPYVRWRDGEIVYDTTPGIGGSHGSQHEFVVETRAPDHPIMRGLPPRWMHAQDELYAELRGPARNLTVLATAYSSPETGGTGEHEPMLITVRYGKGRTFQTMMGDGPPGMACVGLWVTLQRGAEWAATGTVTLTDVPDDFPTETRSSSR